MKSSENGLALIEEFEGCVLHAYPDPATGGAPWMIGHGHTHGVQPGVTCDREQAIAWLRQDVEWAEAAVNTLVTVPLEQHQFEALVCLTFNLGQAALAQNTQLKLLNAERYSDVGPQFLPWNDGPNPRRRSGGMSLAGQVVADSNKVAARLSRMLTWMPWVAAGVALVAGDGGTLGYRSEWKDCQASVALGAARAEEKLNAQKSLDATFTRQRAAKSSASRWVHREPPSPDLTDCQAEPPMHDVFVDEASRYAWWPPRSSQAATVAQGWSS